MDTYLNLIESETVYRRNPDPSKGERQLTDSLLDSVTRRLESYEPSLVTVSGNVTCSCFCRQQLRRGQKYLPLVGGGAQCQSCLLKIALRGGT